VRVNASLSRIVADAIHAARCSICGGVKLGTRRAQFMWLQFSEADRQYDIQGHQKIL
jgi:hypothetical protein